MEIIFNNDGSLKYCNLTDSIIQGDNGTKYIDCAVEGRTPDTYTMVALFRLPNGDENTISANSTVNISVDGTSYSGRRITLTQAQTLYAGKLFMSLRLVDLSNNILYTIERELTVNPSVFEPTEQTITQAQYNSLVQSLASYQVKYALNNVRFYKTLALANADISNLAVDQTVYVENASGNLEAYHKVEGQATLTKYEFADILQALADISATYLTKAQAQTQYQKKLIAGHNIYIDEAGNISAGGDLVGVLDPVTKLPFASFNDLPTPSAATCGAIYFVADPNPESENNCIEYMTIYYEATNTYAWEKYGQATIDLSNYCTLNTNQTIVADKSIGLGKKVKFITGLNTYIEVYVDDGKLYTDGDTKVKNEYVHGNVSIYDTLDADNNTVQSSVKFSDSNGTLKAQIYEDRIEYDIDNSTKTITFATIYNAVNNALINSSSTATTVAIGTLMTDINAAESVFIGSRVAAGNVNRTNQVVIGYNTRGAKDSVVIGHGAQVLNGEKIILIGEANISDATNTNEDVIIGSGSFVRGGGHTAIGWQIKGTTHNSVYPSNDVIIGRLSGNAIDKAVSFDGPTINRPIILYGTDFIKFRNENLDLSKSSFGDYTYGKTLTQVLAGETVTATDLAAGVTVLANSLKVKKGLGLVGALLLDVNSTLSPNTTLLTIDSPNGAGLPEDFDAYLLGVGEDGDFYTFKLTSQGYLINLKEVDNIKVSVKFLFAV